MNIKEKNLELFIELRNCNDPCKRKYLEEKIFKINQRLIWSIINKYGYRGNNVISEEDYFSIGSQGLMKAIHNFDIDRLKNFSTFAYRCIYNEIGTAMKKVNKILHNEISLQSELKSSARSEKEDKITYEDILPSDYDVIEKHYYEEMKKNVNEIIDRTLNEFEAKYIKSYYGLGNETKKTQTAMAKEINMTRAYISKKTIIAKEKLTKELKKIYKEDERTF